MNWTGLTAAVKAELDSVSSPVRLPKGVAFYQRGDRAESLYILRKGQAGLNVLRKNGRCVTLRLVMPFDAFGLSEASGPRRYRTSAEALTPCEAARIPYHQFEKLCERFPQLDRWARGQLAHELHQSWEFTIGLTAAGTIEEKVLFLMPLLAGPTKRRPDATSARRHSLMLPVTQEELASVIGVSREGLNRALSSLRRRFSSEVEPV